MEAEPKDQKTVYISFCAEINPTTAEQLLAATFNMLQQGFGHIYYLFSTPGGFVASGITIYNTLKALPIKTTMHNVGSVDSIGNAIFLAGKERFSCPNSTFMFHGVGFDGQAMRFEEKLLRERLDGLLADQRKIGAVIADQTSLKREEIEGLFREASTKDTEFAMRNGIVQAVKDVSIPLGAPVIQLVFKR